MMARLALRAIILEARRLYEMDTRKVPAVSEMLLDRLDAPTAAEVT